jgi:fructoselysine-6-P-deglycase FrlB-like protein
MSAELTGEGLLAIDREMARQHDDALASFTAVAEPAATIAATIRERKRVTFLGMGGSHAVNRMAEIEYRALGYHAIAVSLSEQLYTPFDLQDSVVFVVSQSGESAEALRVLDALRGHGAAYGMTLEGGSTLGQALPSLVGVGGTEHAFAATRSLMITLALHLAVLAPLGLDPAPAVATLKRRPRLDVVEACKLLRNCRSVVYSGRELRGLAEALALSTMELARMPSYPLEGGQFRHGPLEILGPDVGAIHFCADEQAAPLVAGLARDTLAGGAPTLVFDSSEADTIHGDLILRFPKARGIAAALSMLPTAQRLAIGLAGQRVADVGKPVRSTKITRTE